jgi:hypothetical protein
MCFGSGPRSWLLSCMTCRLPGCNASQLPIGSTASPNARPPSPAGDSADKLYLAIGSVTRDTKHMYSSPARTPVDCAEGSAML